MEDNYLYTDPGKLAENWLSELENVIGSSLPIYLCGRPATLRDVANRQVRERGRYTYMADLVRDDKGQIARICYDRMACRKA